LGAAIGLTLTTRAPGSKANVKFMATATGDGLPSVRKIGDERQGGALREQMRSLPADGEAQSATGRTDSLRRRFPESRLSFCGKGVPSAAENARFHEVHY